MSDLDPQKQKYGAANAVSSDALGILPRNNRNHWRKYHLIREHIQADPGDSILEVGCGDGLHAEKWAEEFDLTAVDLSHSLCAMTKERAPDATVQQGDVRSLEYPDDTFDAVVGTAILHHLPVPQDALREWMRVTKIGGSVTLVEPNYLFPKDFIAANVVNEERHKRQFSPKNVRKWLDAIDGETTHELHTICPPWPSALHPIYDAVDQVLEQTPLRMFAQTQLIHIDVGPWY